MSKKFWSVKLLGGLLSLSIVGCDNKTTYFGTDDTGRDYFISTLNYQDNAAVVDMTLNLPHNYDLFALITNVSDSVNLSATPSLSIRHAVTSALQAEGLLAPQENPSTHVHTARCATPRFVPPPAPNDPMLKASMYEVRANIVTVTPDTYEENSTAPLYVGYSKREAMNFTLRKKVIHEDLTLHVWTPSNDTLITDIMVQTLAQKFLTDSKEDIYHWVTAILGSPWGEQKYDNLIGAKAAEVIDIVLYDIDDDNKAANGVVGFFHPIDNYGKQDTSNERLMFYLDSVFLSNKDGDTWEASDTSPAIVISTLAHEFQHMINFYQKSARNGVISTYWEDEMASLMIEDLLAHRLDDTTIIANRLDSYISAPQTSMTENSDYTALHYGANFLYGAYLLRNFGGAAFLHNFVHNGYTGPSAVSHALALSGYETYTFETTLRNVAAAISLSDLSGLPQGYRLRQTNDNNFETTYNGVTLTLASINLFRDGNRFGGSTNHTKQYGSHAYINIGSTTNSRFDIRASLPKNAQMIIIGK